MSKTVEQKICVCIKFCIANEISCSDTFKMLKKQFEEQFLSEQRIYELYEFLKVEDKPVKTEVDTCSSGSAASTDSV